MADFMERRLKQISLQNQKAQSRQAAGGSEGGPYDPGLEARFINLEASSTELKEGQVRLETASARIEASLASLATKADLVRLDDRMRKLEAEGLPNLSKELAEVKGRVSQLPTALTIFAYMGGLFALEIALIGGTVALMGYLGRLTGR